ncbi:MAG: hypothetical protein ABI334_07715 [Candidatus Dormiibacterota bacterium]
MEARATVRGTGLSKALVAIVTVMVAVALGAGAAALSKGIGGSTAAPAAHIVQGNPAASVDGSAWSYRPSHGGTQPVEGPSGAATTSFLGPDAQERNARLGYQPPFRESYGH